MLCDYVLELSKPEQVQLRLLYPCLFGSPKALEPLSEKNRQTHAVQVVFVCSLSGVLA